MHPSHQLALELARYRGRAGGQAMYLLFRWLFSVIGAWTWAVIAALCGLGLWAKAREGGGS